MAPTVMTVMAMAMVWWAGMGVVVMPMVSRMPPFQNVRMVGRCTTPRALVPVLASTATATALALVVVPRWRMRLLMLELG